MPILNGVHMRIAHGEMVTVVGPNGAGKSTLARVVIGLLRPWAGRVLLHGEDITGTRPHAIVARGVGYAPQRDNVFPSLSVEENLVLGGLGARRGGRQEPALESMFELFPRLHDRRSAPAAALSGGERQLLALARALMASPDLLLLDEPSAGLSPAMVDLVFEHVHAINGRGIAIFMVEQNARRALSISHRGYVLDAGRNRFEGPGPALLRDPKVADLYLGGRGEGERDQTG